MKTTDNKRLTYTCDLCAMHSDFSGVIGLTAVDGTLEYGAAKSSNKHICVSCWEQIEAMQKRFREAVV